MLEASASGSVDRTLDRCWDLEWLFHRFTILLANQILHVFPLYLKQENIINLRSLFFSLLSLNKRKLVWFLFCFAGWLTRAPFAIRLAICQLIFLSGNFHRPLCLSLSLSSTPTPSFCQFRFPFQCGKRKQKMIQKKKKKYKSSTTRQKKWQKKSKYKYSSEISSGYIHTHAHTRTHYIYLCVYVCLVSCVCSVGIIYRQHLLILYIFIYTI